MDAQPPLPPEIWEQMPPVAQELMVAQAAMLAQLRAEVAQWRATVEALAQRVRAQLAQLLPAAFDGSAPDDTTEACAQWTPARRATRPGGAAPSAGPDRGGGCGNPA